MRKSSFFYIFFVSLVFAVSCKTAYQPQSVQYKDYRISEKQTANAELSAMLKPYSDSVNKNMNDVIAVAGMALEKKQPEGTLNNLLSDAMLVMAKQNYQANIDASFLNFGGIRLPSIPAGEITRGKVYEMAPFDNIIVVLKIKGDVLQQFLDLIAARGGWPCSGISYQIKNKKAINVIIAGKPMDVNAIYSIAMLDYIANGGDDADMLRPIPQQNNGYLFRDAVLQYFAAFQQQGKQITSSLEKRVSNAD